MHEPRRATGHDVPHLAAALARAFGDDPVFAWAYGTGPAAPRFTRRYFAIRLRQLLPQDEVWSVPAVGAAAWAAPERWETGARGLLEQLPTLPGLGRRVIRVLRGMALLEKRHPRAPHWYLAHLGVDPVHQGEGLGSALMRPVLEGCDRDGVPAYLESSKERNIAFYARHGFRVTEEVRLPGGPPVWLMWRDPR